MREGQQKILVLRQWLAPSPNLQYHGPSERRKPDKTKQKDTRTKRRHVGE